MKEKIAFTKRDLFVTLACSGFLLANFAAIGPRGRRHAKDILCLSNLQKWGTCFLAFATDNNGRFMAGWHQEYPSNEDYWMQALRPYYGNNHKLRCCPEATTPATELGESQYGALGGAFVGWGVFAGDDCGQPSPEWSPATACDYGSYGNNAWTCDPPPGSYYGIPETNNWRTPNVAGAKNTPLLGDHPWLDCWPHHADEPPEYEDQSWGYGSQMARVCINRHEGFVNWVFLDGSARKVGLKQLWTLKWHRRYDACGPYTTCGGISSGDWPVWMQNFADY